MDQPPSSQWRQRFERNPRDSSVDGEPSAPPGPQPAQRAALDDGHEPPRRATPASPPETVSEQAALALAIDERDYRPWTLLRGRSQLAMMLHLRRFEPRSGLWQGWQLSYPHLIAVEYTGDKMISLDFGTRHFIIAGSGLIDLVGHLQTGAVLTITEHSNQIWPNTPVDGPCVSSIRCVTPGD